ncbi:hypothetical protein [Rhodococcus sp. KRD162]|jgi:hypothetical protein|uniref:hypothetical protein n=1 Tax=Rhodococcus sp. KRD162 TaxID=2729725 RepID=UPI0019D1592C|nr:hypothetical protein [Rhodococcus sp. KRD162]
MISPEMLEPRRLASVAIVAERLTVSRAVANRLVAAEVGGPSFRGKTDLMMAEADLAVLAARQHEWADTTVPALNVRVAPARWCADQNRFLGWHARLPEDLLPESIGKWWNVRDAEQVKGAAFVAAIGGWVVHVARVTDVHTDRGQRAFDFGPATDEQLAAYAGRRIPPVPGPAILRFGLD